MSDYNHKVNTLNFLLTLRVIRAKTKYKTQNKLMFAYLASFRELI